MAVGTQPTVPAINDQMTQLSLQWRNVAQQSLNLFTTINEFGGDTGLTAGFEAIGFSPTDAAAASSLLSYMNTLTGVYDGTVQAGGSGGTGATLFNYENALSILWAGQ